MRPASCTATSLVVTLAPRATMVLPPTTIGSSRLARNVSPVWFTEESTGSIMRTVNTVPAGRVTPSDGGAVEAAGVVAVRVLHVPLPLLVLLDG